MTEDSHDPIDHDALTSDMPPQVPDDVKATPPTSSPASVPKTIGNYRIKRVMGEGGMGIVYEAEQEAPRRTVALKVIRAGVAGATLLRRFEYEAQILGRLDHPGIATIFEAGTFDAGAGPQPFFAMELVKGLPLTEYADGKKLGTRQRLELLARIAEAVQHAHQKGIIHRDLKPANILVTTEGQAKILDFGVARAVDRELRATSLHTQVGQVVGTVTYMSPEQASADPDDLDTRSDVYALGVIGYELLSGRLPYDLAGTKLHEAVRIINEQEPARLRNLNSTFRGDIETIIGMALAKEKTRRYQSALDFAVDIRRYLNDEPVSARPSTMRYQLTKFAKRNKAFVIALAALVFVLIAGVVVSTTFAIGQARARLAETESREKAQRETAIARTATAFIEKMLGAPDPTAEQQLVEIARDVRVIDVLDSAAQELEQGKFADEPLVAAAIRETLGLTYMGLGDYGPAEIHLQAVLDLRSKYLTQDNLDTADAMNNLAVLYDSLGRYADAEPLYESALRIKRRAVGEDDPSTLLTMGNLAVLYSQRGRLEKAGLLFREIHEKQSRILGAEHRNTLATANNLANIYAEQERYDEAEALLVPALEAFIRILGEDHPSTLGAILNLAYINRGQQRFDEVAQALERVIQIGLRVQGPEHPDVLQMMGNLAEVYQTLGRLEQAERQYLQILEIAERVLPQDHLIVLVYKNNLAELMLDDERYDEAATLYANVVEVARPTMTGHPYLGMFLVGQGRCFAATGQFDQAEPTLLEAFEILRDSMGSDHGETQKAVRELIALYDTMGQPDQAAQWRAKLPSPDNDEEGDSPETAAESDDDKDK